MPEWLAIGVALLGAASTALGILNAARTAKRTSPHVERWRELDEWRAGVDGKLGTDKLRIDRHERNFDDSEKFQRLMLYAVKGILEHLESGNHNGEMREIVKKIDAFLIDR